MSETVVRRDPGKISTTLKEAVLDGLLNMTYAHISGDGEVGKYLYGARPRTLLNSGFLLPQQTPFGDDEVISPIWISSHGTQLQVSLKAETRISIQPRLSLYVRVLPTEKELSRPDCKAIFTLKPEVAREIKDERNRRLEAEWERVKGNYASKRVHPEWKSIRERILEEVYVERGIPPRLVLDIDVEEPPTEPDASVEDTPPIEGVQANVDEAASINDEYFEPLNVPHKWMRLDISVPELTLDLSESNDSIQSTAADHVEKMHEAIALQLKSWIESDDKISGGKLWGYRSQLSVPPSKYKHWQHFLDLARSSSNELAVPEITLGWDIELVGDWVDSSKKNLHIALENRSQEPHQYRDETDPACFLVTLQLKIPQSMHCPLKLERIDPSYRYNQYLQHAGLGQNCGIKVVSSSPEDLIIQTTWRPRYVQPRIVPTNISGVERNIRALSKPESTDGLTEIAAAMQSWVNHQKATVDTGAGLSATDRESRLRESEAFKEDISRWIHEKEAIEAGVRLLIESKGYWKKRGKQTERRAIPYEAWLAMNEAMANFMKVRFRNDDKDNSWHLFQLAFILANLPALASRMSEYSHYYKESRDDSVTLLYFATGGGKSEAFFGLLVFNLLLDRLRGKECGVTAMLRYPLRLLTIQQAQRCAKILAQAELVRVNHGYGGQQLSIGFWVGSGGSPNRHNDKGVISLPEIEEIAPTPSAEEKLRDDNQKYSAALRAWNKIPACPFCASTTALRRFPKLGGTLAHVCTNMSCASNAGGWAPLPFYICDDDIYDFAPAVLLGTVDKLALIGHSPQTIRRVLGMFGVAPWFDVSTQRFRVPTSPRDLKAGPEARGMTGVYPTYKGGLKLIHDPFPSLIIQDEAHLLDESLGTFAGLFESTLDAIFDQLAKPLSGLIAVDLAGKRRRPKVITASATVSEPERQLEHLYQRAIPAVQFPYPGPNLYESFYARPQSADPSETERRAILDPEIAAKQARIYCAFMTNGKPHTATSIAVLASFHYCITKLFDAFTSGDAKKSTVTKERLSSYISTGQLQALHREALEKASDSELATIIDLHRIALTYVTNKKGGDQIMAAEAEETRKRHLNEGVELSGLGTRLITGSVDQGEIQAVVQAAQKRDEPGQKFTPLGELLRSVIATSAISHGVDVEEFNSMFFAGMPSDIAEYIQASSRVGRTHIGFVVLIPTPQRRRDRHIVEIFDIFHRFLERMVQPAAIDRWAEKAVERIYPSILQAYLTGVVPSRKLIELDEDKKDQTPNYTSIPSLRTEYGRRGEAMLAEINAFVEVAIGLKDGYEPEGADHYRHLIDKHTRYLITNQWASQVWGTGSMYEYFNAISNPMDKPMTSLRDVDQGGRIVMSSRGTTVTREGAKAFKQDPRDLLNVMDMIRLGTAQSEEGEA